MALVIIGSGLLRKPSSSAEEKIIGAGTRHEDV